MVATVAVRLVPVEADLSMMNRTDINIMDRSVVPVRQGYPSSLSASEPSGSPDTTLLQEATLDLPCWNWILPVPELDTPWFEEPATVDLISHAVEGDSMKNTQVNMYGMARQNEGFHLATVSPGWPGCGKWSAINTSIQADGSPFKMTANLQAFSTLFRSPLRPSTLWIDAICIDQSNNPERNAQIRLMKTAYKRADSTSAECTDKMWRVICGLGSGLGCIALCFLRTFPENALHTIYVARDYEKAMEDIKAYKSGKAEGHPDEVTWAAALQGAISKALLSWLRMNHREIEISCSRNLSPDSLMPNEPRNRQRRRMIGTPNDDHIPESNMNSFTPFHMIRHRARFRALWPLIPT
ncbi:hypothetical protein H2202_009614 [Exophiala xenobiotica]|nr:hypothetical protein H2202_009614 [Exophiala xenobiotica]